MASDDDSPKNWASDIGEAKKIKREVRQRILHGDPLPLYSILSKSGQSYANKCDITHLLERQGRLLACHGVHQSDKWRELKLRRAFAVRVIKCEAVCNEKKIKDFKTAYEFKGERFEMPDTTSPEQLNFMAQKAIAAASTVVEDFRRLLEIHVAGKIISAEDQEEYLNQDAWLSVFEFEAHMWATICRDMFEHKYFIGYSASHQDVLAASVRHELLSLIEYALEFQQFNINHFVFMGGDAKYVSANDSVDEITALLSKTGL